MSVEIQEEPTQALPFDFSVQFIIGLIQQNHSREASQWMVLFRAAQDFFRQSQTPDQRSAYLVMLQDGSARLRELPENKTREANALKLDYISGRFQIWCDNLERLETEDALEELHLAESAHP